MINNPCELYAFAEDRGIEVDWFSMREVQSLSLALPDGTCCIAIDPWKMNTMAQETVSLAHELGHCETGSFYSRHSQFDVRQKHENRADKWAIKKLIPEDELNAAVANGRTEAWELAEIFSVTEDYIRKAVQLYKDGHL